MQKIDIVIIGGGPAGLATAMHLLQRSPAWASRMVVIEKGRHPRFKLCGGGITPFGQEQLRRLGLQLDFPHVRVPRIAISYLDLEAEYAGSPAAVVVDRPVFDDWLLQQARARGVRVHEDCAVTSLERMVGGVRVNSSKGAYLARAVVGADGSTGKTRQWLVDGYRQKTARVLEVFSPRRSGKGEKPEITFRFDPALKDVQGYFWEFPALQGGSTVFSCGVYDARVHRGPRADLRSALAEALQKESGLDPVEAGRVQGAPIRLFSPWNQLSSERVLLAGDAAGAEPLFGEGISMALAYGEAAAAELERAFNAGRFDFRGYRQRVLFSTLGRYMTLRWLVAAAGYRLASSERIVRALWWLVKLLVKREHRFR